MIVQPTGYWTFFCNPAKWEIDLFLASRAKDDDFLITDWQADWFKRGQLGVVRVGTDQRSKGVLHGRPRLQPGIYGIVEVRSNPWWTTGQGDKYWLGTPPKKGTRRAVDIRYLKCLPSNPLLLRDLREMPGINDKYMIEGFQASSMPLDPGTFHTLQSLARIEGLAPKEFDLQPADNAEVIAKLEAEYASAPPKVREVISQQIERGAVATKLKEIASFKCQVCKELGLEPIGFRKRNGQPYVEAHHVMPVARGQIGALRPSNVIVVCANHHRQLHYGVVTVAADTKWEFAFKIDGKTIRIAKFGVAKRS